MALNFPRMLDIHLHCVDYFPCYLGCIYAQNNYTFIHHLAWFPKGFSVSKTALAMYIVHDRLPVQVRINERYSIHHAGQTALPRPVRRQFLLKHVHHLLPKICPVKHNTLACQWLQQLNFLGKVGNELLTVAPLHVGCGRSGITKRHIGKPNKGLGLGACPETHTCLAKRWQQGLPTGHWMAESDLHPACSSTACSNDYLASSPDLPASFGTRSWKVWGRG